MVFPIFMYWMYWNYWWKMTYWVLRTCSFWRTTKLLFQGPSWSEWYIFSLFFVYLLFLKKVPRLKTKAHIIQTWMSKWIFEVVKSCARKMVKRTHFLLNSEMVKTFIGRSNRNFGSHQWTIIRVGFLVIRFEVGRGVGGGKTTAAF